jgi:large subunit ribosomal protein L4e
MKTPVLDLEGKNAGEIELPVQFNGNVRPDVIRRAFHAEATLDFQPKGVSPYAGMQTSAEYFGRRHRPRASINVGKSRLPREKLAGMRLGRVRRVPHSVKGRRAHPPKPEKMIIERINMKEKKLAVRSAIAATGKSDVVTKRGHIFEGKLPVVVDNSFESIKKSAQARSILVKLGFGKDLMRAESGRKPARGRKGGYKTPRSVLVVYAKDNGVARAVANLPGVQAVRVDALAASLLAPGGVAGRLTLWTKDAISELGAKKLFE